MSSPLVGIDLRVADAEAQESFYRRLLGLEVVDEGPERVELAPADRAYRVRLRERSDAQPRPRPSIGLFHVAFRLPSRPSLARTLAHLDEEGLVLEGASNHGVSEALYLSDPEGNGIELYRDLAREDWPTRGEHVAMTTDPLDVDELRARASGGSPPPDGTDLGHIHLHVPDLDEAERFFADGLGLRVRQRDYPGARFLAVDDYHHHVGVNTWARGRQAPRDAVGLEAYTWAGNPGQAGGSLQEGGWQPRESAGSIEVEDPSGLKLRVVEA